MKRKILITFQLILALCSVLSLYLMLTSTEENEVLAAATLFLFYTGTYCFTLPATRSQIKTK